MKMKPRTGRLALLAFTLLLIIGRGAARADVIYVTGAGNEFGTLDLGTGAFNQITTLNTQTLYAMGTGGPGSLTGLDINGEAYFINAKSGATTDLGNTGLAPIGGGGTGSVLYAFDLNTSSLVAVTYGVTGTTNTTIGTYARINADGLVVNGHDGNIYLAAITAGNDDLYKINIATGVATDLGTTGDSGLYAGVLDGGKIYGFDSLGNILTFSTKTGAGTIVGTYSLPNSDAIYTAALAPAVVPEPSALTLLGVGLSCAVGMAVRRRVMAP